MIGMFDSGVGGLSVLREVRALLPSSDLVYLADSVRAPYGPRPASDVRAFSEQIAARLIREGAGIVVIACNAASTAALHPLRAIHPGVPFVGMEPAVKPAVAATRTGVIGVLTTAVTSQGDLFASVVDRFAGGIEVVTEVCDGWVELVEEVRTDGAEVEEAVERHVEPVLAKGADTLVLACTHFPFLAGAVRRAAGPDAAIVDPAPAVARQVARVASRLRLDAGTGSLRLLSSGSPERLARAAASLAGLEAPAGSITWEG